MCSSSAKDRTNYLVNYAASFTEDLPSILYEVPSGLHKKKADDSVLRMPEDIQSVSSNSQHKKPDELYAEISGENEDTPDKPATYDELASADVFPTIKNKAKSLQTTQNRKKSTSYEVCLTSGW